MNNPKNPKWQSHNEPGIEQPHKPVEEVKQDPSSEVPEMFRKFRAMKLFKYANFDHKKSKFLDAFDYSWDIHGCQTLSKFLPTTTQVITSQMNFAFNMTGCGETQKQIDTRNAIVFYLKEIHGIRDEQFKFKKINELFEVSEKVYIKKVMCSPHEVTIDDYTSINSQLTDKDKADRCILVMETKRHVSLVYLAKALSEYMS